MIQRIQTVFLFLAFLASLCLFFFPLAGIYGETNTYHFFIYEFRNMVPGEVSVLGPMVTLPLVAVNSIIVVLALVSIFLYKKRIMQMRLVRISIFLEIILIGLVFFVYGNIIEKNLLASPDYLGEIGIYFPLASLVFLILSNIFINKDEKLVRSIDRLR